MESVGRLQAPCHDARVAAVALEDVEKVYADGTVGVRRLSLEVGDGEVVALVGPSGCGKSTTLRMIAGLEAPSAGRVLLGERDVTRVAPRDRDVAMVFQDYALYPHMTVRKNLAFALGLRGAARAEIVARTQRWSRALGLEGVLDKRPGALSGGQRQRVALARALVREPACFLFDEPLSNLDAKLRAEARGEIRALLRSLGRAAVWVTHDQEEAMTMGDRLVVMHGGAVEQVGPPLEVYRRPATRFVASLVGTPPMGFVEGTVHLGALDVGAGTLPLGALPAAREGQRLCAGIRPDALVPADAGLATEVIATEPLGAHTDVRLRVGTTYLLMRMDSDAASGLAPGRRLSVRASALHLFDEDGRRLPGAP